MSSFIFYNVKKDGEFEPVDHKKSAFNARRTIVVQDPFDKTIWVVDGTSSSKAVKEQARLRAKELNAELAFQFQINEVDKKKKNKLIEELLEKSALEPPKIEFIQPSKKKSKEMNKNNQKEQLPNTIKEMISRDIPKVSSKINKSSSSVLPRGDLDESKKGPMIQEFQIAYIDDDGEQVTKKAITTFTPIIKFVQSLEELQRKNATQDQAKNILSDVLNEIVLTYFLE